MPELFPLLLTKSVVNLAKRDGNEAPKWFSKLFVTEAPGMTLNSRDELIKIELLLPKVGESSSILDFRRQVCWFKLQKSNLQTAYAKPGKLTSFFYSKQVLIFPKKD